MKTATYNVNGINARLPVLLRWLIEARPDVVCLQELKAPQEKFPASALHDAGQGQKSWNGVAILARGTDPIETQRGLLGSENDLQSRYIEAAIDGVLVGCLYLPNVILPLVLNLNTNCAGSSSWHPGLRTFCKPMHQSFLQAIIMSCRRNWTCISLSDG